jgi:hypothetical protein
MSQGPPSAVSLCTEFKEFAATADATEWAYPVNLRTPRTDSVVYLTALFANVRYIAQARMYSESEGGMNNKGRLLFAGLLSLSFIQPLAISRAEEAADGPLASIAGSIEGVHIDILSLKRTEGNMVTLRVAFVNDSGSPVRVTDFPGVDNVGIWKVALLDYKNKRKYGVVWSADGCLCTTNLPWSKDFEPGRQVLWAKMTAPPNSVQRIALIAGPGEPVEGLPIAR